MKARRFCLSLLASAAAIFSIAMTSALAAPAVRIAVVPGSGSGMEQDIVDRISNDLKANPNVKISTVNPDWFVQCNIVDRTDTAGGSVRVNGTVVIKTTDGHVLDTVSMQTNKQDFSLQPGTPVNKMLFDKAVREVIQGVVERARQPLSDAIDTEIKTREKIISAQRLSDDDKYSEAIELLSPVSPDTPHFAGVRKLIAEFEMEEESLNAIQEAQNLAHQRKFKSAIDTLRNVDKKSKRFSMAMTLASRYKAQLVAHQPHLAPAKAKTAAKSSSTVESQLKALDAQKKALEAQKRAVEAQESALRIKTN